MAPNPKITESEWSLISAIILLHQFGINRNPKLMWIILSLLKLKMPSVCRLSSARHSIVSMLYGKNRRNEKKKYVLSNGSAGSAAHMDDG